MSGFTRFVTYLVVIAMIAALYAGYNPVGVAAYWPAAAPYAKQIHDLLPTAITGQPPPTATGTAPAAGQ